MKLLMFINVEAASKLEKVSEECKKTEDVDIDGMLTNTNQCIQCLNELANAETNKPRLVSIVNGICNVRTYVAMFLLVL